MLAPLSLHVIQTHMFSNWVQRDNVKVGLAQLALG